MTYPDAMTLLREKVAEYGQAEVARMLAVSAAAISQILSGKYNAAPDAILTRVIEIFGGLSVDCPIQGEIPLRQCVEDRKKPFTTANSLRVELFKTCPGCEKRR